MMFGVEEYEVTRIWCCVRNTCTNTYEVISNLYYYLVII